MYFHVIQRFLKENVIIKQQQKALKFQNSV